MYLIVTSSRFDLLNPDQQLVLKVASVIGYRFSLEPLLAIVPLQKNKMEIFESILETELILSTEERSTKFCFQQVAVQETIYSMTAFSDKTKWHRELADWYEVRNKAKVSFQ